jgi:hypothetical protein
MKEHEIPVEQDYVLNDCEKIHKRLSKELENLQNAFIGGDYLGDRQELLTEIARRAQELKSLDELIIRRIVKRNERMGQKS